MAKLEKCPQYVELRHRKGCGGLDNHLDPRCKCAPHIRAGVYIDGKKVPHVVKGMRPAKDRCAEAHAWAVKAKEYADTGRHLLLEDMTVAQCWATWLKGAQEGSILSNRDRPYQKSSLVRWANAMRLVTLPEVGTLDLKVVTPKRLRELVTKLRFEDERGDSDVRNAIVPLSTMYRWAVESDMVELNPCLGVRLPGYKSKKITVPSLEDQDKMVDAAERAGAKVPWALAFYGGARRAEALGLQWDMVDLTPGHESITYSRTFIPDQEVKDLKDDAKTDAGTRTVPMVGPLATILREHKLATGRSEGFVFSESALEPWGGHWPIFYRKVQAEIAKDNLPKLTFHDLRHVYASRIIRAAAESGEAIDWHEIGTLMGHTSVAFTMDTYAHMVPDYLDRHRKYQDAHYKRHAQ